MTEPIAEVVTRVLKTPVGSVEGEPNFGFDALDPDGATKAGLIEQVLAAMARAALTRFVDGVTFNEITAHRDEAGRLMRIEVDFMDQIHDPSPREVTVSYEAD